MSAQETNRLMLACVGQHVAIEIQCVEALKFFRENFAGMFCSEDVGASLCYDILPESGGYRLRRSGSDWDVRSSSLGELVYFLEGDIVVQLQLLRPDLLFLHAAVISRGRSSCLVTGPSGAGKSTTCWGLLHHGFRYTSDELAPIALSDKTVLPYAHALCLKRAPSADYQLPDRAIQSTRGFHVPVSAMPLPFEPAPPPLRFLVFVQFDARRLTPEIVQIDAAEATARLYPNVLNALAHEDDGLAPVADLVSGLTCLKVRSAPLKITCELLVQRLIRA